MAPGKTHGWSVMGTGTIATEQMVAAFRAVGDRPLWVVSRKKRDATLFAQDLDIPTATTDLKDVWADPDVRNVYVSAVLPRRKHYISNAAARGKHILCDGPIANRSRTAAELTKICERAGVLLAINQPFRASTIHQTMRRLIAEGEIGTVQSIVIVRGGPYSPIPSRRSQLHGDVGDVLLDASVDAIDLVRFLTGAEPMEATAVTRPNAGENKHVAYTMAMDNGALFQAHESFSTTDLESLVMVSGDKAALIAHGTLGGRGPGLLARRLAGRTELIPVREREPYLATVESFNHALADAPTFLATGKDSVAALRAIEAIEKAARQGRTIAVET